MKLTGHRCRCGACGEVFSRASVFDKHRVGPYGNRRCLEAGEFAALGFRLVDGVWKGPPKVVQAELQTTSLQGRVIGRVEHSSAYYASYDANGSPVSPWPTSTS